MKVSSYIFFAPRGGKFLSNYDQKKINNHPIFYSQKNKSSIVCNLLFLNYLTEIANIALKLDALIFWLWAAYMTGNYYHYHDYLERGSGQERDDE